MPPTHWKLLPTSGVAVTTVGTVALKGRRNEAEHPVHRTGGLPGTTSNAHGRCLRRRGSSVRAETNFLCTVRLATMSTKQVEPLRRVQPVQLDEHAIRAGSRRERDRRPVVVVLRHNRSDWGRCRNRCPDRCSRVAEPFAGDAEMVAVSLKSTVAVWVTPCAMKLHVLPESRYRRPPTLVTLLPRTGVAVKLALVPVSICRSSRRRRGCRARSHCSGSPRCRLAHDERGDAGEQRVGAVVGHHREVTRRVRSPVQIVPAYFTNRLRRPGMDWKITRVPWSTSAEHVPHAAVAAVEARAGATDHPAPVAEVAAAERPAVTFTAS